MSKYYPSTLDLEAVNDVIGFYKGDKPIPEVVESAWHVGGFAMSQFLPTGVKVGSTEASKCCDAASMSNDDKINLLEQVVTACEPCDTEETKTKALNISWVQVWAIVKQVIDLAIAG